MKLRDLLPPALATAIPRRSRDAQRWQEYRTGLDEAKLLAAKLLIEQHRARGLLPRLADAEFKVFSQFGDDGIIQYLIHCVGATPHTFVEFGVENYQEANTRFLLVNDNWKGLVFDGSQPHIRSIERDSIYWRHDLTAAAAFIDRDNIDGLLGEHGFAGDLGLLSIDIDGNDYWVWERITSVLPAIVIVEYNSVFGSRHAVSIPYDPTFQRTRAHFSNLYWGCSLPALCLLAERKGYSFVGCNSNGNNAYFVHQDLVGDLPTFDARSGYVESRFRESRNEEGRLTYLSGNDRLQAIAQLAVVDVETGKPMRCGELTD